MVKYSLINIASLCLLRTDYRNVIIYNFYLLLLFLLILCPIFVVRDIFTTSLPYNLQFTIFYRAAVHYDMVAGKCQTVIYYENTIESPFSGGVRCL